MNEQKGAADDAGFGTFQPGFPDRVLFAAASGPGFLRKRIWKHINLREPQPYDVERYGVRFRLWPHDDKTSRTTLLKRQRNSPERRFMHAALRKGGVMVDGGAHIGTMCLPLANMPNVRIVAVEPNPFNVARLKYNIDANGFANVEVAPVALSDHDGVVQFRVDHGNQADSMVESGAGSTEVDSLSLLSLLGSFDVDQTTLLKLDLERHEDAVMLPFLAAADRSQWPRHVLIEAITSKHPEPRCVEAMRKLGYRQVVKTGQNIGLSLI